MAKKVFTIVCTRHRTGAETPMTGTIEELVDSCSYTLEVGQSWQHEEGNHKINRSPKTIKTLIRNLNWAKDNAAANGYADRHYSIPE